MADQVPVHPPVNGTRDDAFEMAKDMISKFNESLLDADNLTGISSYVSMLATAADRLDQPEAAAACADAVKKAFTPDLADYSTNQGHDAEGFGSGSTADNRSEAIRRLLEAGRQVDLSSLDLDNLTEDLYAQLSQAPGAPSSLETT